MAAARMDGPHGWLQVMPMCKWPSWWAASGRPQTDPKQPSDHTLSEVFSRLNLAPQFYQNVELFHSDSKMF